MYALPSLSRVRGYSLDGHSEADAEIPERICLKNRLVADETNRREGV